MKQAVAKSKGEKLKASKDLSIEDSDAAATPVMSQIGVKRKAKDNDLDASHANREMPRHQKSRDRQQPVPRERLRRSTSTKSELATEPMICQVCKTRQECTQDKSIKDQHSTK